MKTALFTAVLAFAVSSFAHEHEADSSILAKSRIGTAAAASLEMFETTSNGTLWSLTAAVDEDEVLGKILYVNPQSSVHVAEFDCHFHSHGGREEAHCHDGAETPVSLQPPASLAFDTVDAYTDSLINALDVFERKVSASQNITAMKMWQHDDEINVSLKYQAAQGPAEAYFMCHLHNGVHIDCHRTRSAGANEPSF